MSVMVAFLPYDVDAEDIAREGGLPVDELHVTSRYYGKKPDPQLVDRLRDLVIDIGASFAPFVADITAQGNLGKDDALVLHLASPHGEFEHARDMLPEPGDDVTTYPGYTPHLTLGYKMSEDEADQVDDSVGIKFDRIALAEDGDWFVVQLDGDRPPAAHIGADDPDVVGYKPMMGYDELTEWKDDMPMPRVAGVFKLFTKKPKGKTPAFTKKQRDEMAESGEAMSNGEYPIRDKHGEQDLANAVAAIGRAKDRAAVEAHIRKRAKALGLTDKLPPWIRKESKTAGLEPGWGYATPADVHAHYNPRVRTAAIDPRSKGGGKHQKCLHGSKATCKSVHWIAAYTALRERRGFSKKKAAMIANAMHRAWKEGRPWGAPGRKGIIKKRKTV